MYNINITHIYLTMDRSIFLPMITYNPIVIGGNGAFIDMD